MQRNGLACTKLTQYVQLSEMAIKQKNNIQPDLRYELILLHQCQTSLRVLQRKVLSASQ